MYPERINIEPTRRSPWVVMEPGRIFIMGRSIIDNPTIFYEPGMKWISEFMKEWTGKTRIDLGFEYINTGSIKWLFMLLRVISEGRNLSENISITWYYEQGDDDMSELGFILRSLVDTHFTIVEVDEMNTRSYSGFFSQNN